MFPLDAHPVRRSIYIALFLLALSEALSGQMIDTTKEINTWQLKHNFTRFEDVPLDTNMHQLHQEYNPAFEHGFSYESLGNLGHALNHVDFYLRPDANQFFFGRAWDPYRKTPERTLFFNTRALYLPVLFHQYIYQSISGAKYRGPPYTKLFSLYQFRACYLISWMANLSIRTSKPG